MKRLIRMAIAGSTGLFVGAAMAGAPGTGGFGQYSVTGGTPSGCPAGATCTPLVASSNGFMQQSVAVTSGVGAGNTYIQTVITGNGVTTTNPAALAFSNETFVGATSNSGALASQGKVNLTSAGLAGAGSTTSTLARGNLAITGTAAQVRAGTADATGIRINQVLTTAYNGGTTIDANGNPNYIGQLTGAGDSAGRFDYDGFSANLENATNAATFAPHISMVFDYASLSNGSSYSNMNEYTNLAGVGYMKVVRVNGDFTSDSGTLTLPDSQSIAYAAGDDIQVTLMQNAALGGGPFGFPASTTANPFATAAHGSANGWQQAQHYTNYTSGASIEWVNDVTTNSTADTNQAAYNNSGMSGLAALVAFTPVQSYTYTGVAPTAPSGLLSWANWNSNFGTAPRANTKITNTSTGVQALLSPTLYTVAFP